MRKAKKKNRLLFGAGDSLSLRRLEESIITC